MTSVRGNPARGNSPPCLYALGACRLTRHHMEPWYTVIVLKYGIECDNGISSESLQAVTRYAFFMLLSIFHSHDWSDWQDSLLNKYSGHHLKTASRYCKGCEECQTNITTIDCTKFKRIGEWCELCKPYTGNFSLVIDENLKVMDNGRMKEKKPIKKYGNHSKIVFEEQTDRNRQIFDAVNKGEETMEEIGMKFGVSRQRVFQLYAIHKKKLEKLARV